MVVWSECTVTMATFKTQKRLVSKILLVVENEI